MNLSCEASKKDGFLRTLSKAFKSSKGLLSMKRGFVRVIHIAYACDGCD